MSQASVQPTPLAIFEAVQSYQRTFILKAAVDLDIFSAVGQGRHTATEIAAACGASERGTRSLCDVLTAHGFLSKAENKYSLTPDTALFLDKRSPAYLGGALNFLLHPSQTQSMVNLAEAVRRGGAPAGQSTLEAEDPVWEDFARGMAPLMKPQADAIADLLQPHLAGKTSPKVLDIAAGHGIFGITVAQKVPGLQIYALDWANVLRVAADNARKAGLGERHHLIPGDAFTAEFGTGYDAVLLTNFLHHFAPEENVKLLRKCLHAMNPGGTAVILEFVPNDDRVSPLIPANFSVVMLSTTPQGDAYTFQELSRMCRDAGFEDIQLVGLDPLPQSLVVARRPV
jgi:2-polyprenyl-3-methyl-5-hydroxy-6-metoxy-1,4-benzoquinol methylase/predicted transcriptional regulator